MIFFKIMSIIYFFIDKILIQGPQYIFGRPYAARGPQFGHICFVANMIHFYRFNAILFITLPKKNPVAYQRDFYDFEENSIFSGPFQQN